MENDLGTQLISAQLGFILHLPPLCKLKDFHSIFNSPPAGVYTCQEKPRHTQFEVMPTYCQINCLFCSHSKQQWVTCAGLLKRLFPKLTQALSTYCPENSQNPQDTFPTLCALHCMVDVRLQEGSLKSRALQSSCNTELELSGNKGLREHMLPFSRASWKLHSSF